MSGIWLLLRIAILIALAPAVAWADGERLALVIGNADYRHAPALNNPVNDANLIASTLEQIGFDVRLEINADVDQSRAAQVSFLDELRQLQSPVAIFYFAGHGLQVDDTNYLLPVDAELARIADLRVEATSLDDIVHGVETANPSGTNLVIIDAARDNPFPSRLNGTRGTRSISRGLGRIEAHRGTVILFSTSAGMLSMDGEGTHSTFARALAEELTEPGVESA